MNEGINLLDPNKENTGIVPVHKLQIMRIIAVGLLFAVSVSSVVLFILVTLSPLPELKKQEQSLHLTLSQSHNEMVKMALINERTNAIEDILLKRNTFDQRIELVQSVLPNTAAISSMRVDHETITLTVESKSLQALDTFLNGLIQLVQTKNGFSQITMTDLTTNESKYSLSVNLVVIKL